MEDILSIKVKNKIKRDVKKIEDLIFLQLSMKNHKKCPLYQDVIDTQIFGISKELELAVEMGFVNEEYSRTVLDNLESKLSLTYNDIDIKKN